MRDDAELQHVAAEARALVKRATEPDSSRFFCGQRGDSAMRTRQLYVPWMLFDCLPSRRAVV
jgi:hypothetical protein